MSLKKIAPFVENVAESGAACLVMMVQGNVLALGLSHWLIASQTGVVAGTATTAALALARTDRRWITAVVLGAVTAVVDYFVHPGMMGSPWTEALATGAGAATLSYLVGSLIAWYRDGGNRRAGARG